MKKKLHLIMAIQLLTVDGEDQIHTGALIGILEELQEVHQVLPFLILIKESSDSYQAVLLLVIMIVVKVVVVMILHMVNFLLHGMAVLQARDLKIGLTL